MGDKRIPISEENREELKALKRGQETYDDVLDRLLTAPSLPDDEVDSIGDALDDDELAIIGTENAVVDELVARLEAATGDGDIDTSEQLDRIEAAAKEATEAAQNAESAIEEVTGR